MLKKIDIGTSEIEQVEAFNALVDAVNELQHDNSEKANHQENVQPDADKIGKLETELDRTRKALDVAVDALKDCEKILKADRKDWGYLTAKVALNQIEALDQIQEPEQKDK